MAEGIIKKAEEEKAGIIKEADTKAVGIISEAEKNAQKKAADIALQADKKAQQALREAMLLAERKEKEAMDKVSAEAGRLPWRDSTILTPGRSAAATSARTRVRSSGETRSLLLRITRSAQASWSSNTSSIGSS